MFCIGWVERQPHVLQILASDRFFIRVGHCAAMGKSKRKADDSWVEPLAERLRKTQKMFAHEEEWDEEGFRRLYTNDADALHQSFQPGASASSSSHQPMRTHREAALLAHRLGEAPRAAVFAPARHTAMIEGRPVQVLLSLSL